MGRAAKGWSEFNLERSFLMSGHDFVVIEGNSESHQRSIAMHGIHTVPCRKGLSTMPARRAGPT